MIADGNPAEVRGINQIGLERHGFPAESTRALREPTVSFTARISTSNKPVIRSH